VEQKFILVTGGAGLAPIPQRFSLATGQVGLFYREI
jgi:hypothetical protein